MRRTACVRAARAMSDSAHRISCRREHARQASKRAARSIVRLQEPRVPRRGPRSSTTHMQRQVRLERTLLAKRIASGARRAQLHKDVGQSARPVWP